MLLSKLTNDMTEEKVSSLFIGKQENKTLEFKSLLKLDTNDEKKEFLNDISSFANATGGTILFGIKETSGVCEEILGFPIQDADSLKLQIENLLRDCIEPNLQNVEIFTIKLLNNNILLVIEIQESYNKPHVVNFRGHWRAYSRNSAGKFPLDIFELKNLINESYELSQGISKYRLQRLSAILSEDIPVKFENPDSAKLIIHAIPQSSFYNKIAFNLNEVRHWPDLIMPVNGDYCQQRINFDGILSSCPGRSNSVTTKYFQLYRNGIIETVNSSLTSNGYNSDKGIWLEMICQGIIQFVKQIIELYKILNVLPPIYILLTLVDLQDHDLLIDPQKLAYERHRKFDRGRLLIPEINVTNYNLDIPMEFRFAFDMMWNSAGYDKAYF